MTEPVGPLGLVPELPDEGAGTEPQQVTVRMTQVPVALASGRPAFLVVPADLTDYETLSLINGVIQVSDALRAQQPASRIVGPNGLPMAAQAPRS